MKRPIHRLSIAALALATGLVFSAQAQNEAAEAAKRKELAAAQAELQRAAKRVAELSRDQEMAAMKRHVERRPMLGVLLAPDPQVGVRITGVTPDSGAARAGLRAGDQLVKIDDKTIAGKTAEERLAAARQTLSQLKVGEPVKVLYRRGPEERQIAIEPQPGRPVMVFTDGGSRDGVRVVMAPGGDKVETVEKFGFDQAFESSFNFDEDFNFDFDGVDFDAAQLAISPEIQRELMKVRDMANCKDGESCVVLPRMAEAFRWNGLNLSSVDSKLGRYFGTDKGVLVLSTGSDLEGLQAGDVIQRIDGRAVATPREVMEALRGRPADSSVKVDYLRDRKVASAAVKIPRATQLVIPVPPAPPAPPAPPPAPPTPPSPAAKAPPAPPAAVPAPPAPPAAPTAPAWVTSQKQVVVVDRGGKRYEYRSDSDVPPPAPPAAPPAPSAPTPPAPPAVPGVPV